MNELIAKLNELGLTTTTSLSNDHDEFMIVCRTPSNNMVVVSHISFEYTGSEPVYAVDFYNCTTTNCFYTVEPMLEAIKNYLKN